jgi:hypothetical protein
MHGPGPPPSLHVRAALSHPRQVHSQFVVGVDPPTSTNNTNNTNNKIGRRHTGPLSSVVPVQAPCCLRKRAAALSPTVARSTATRRTPARGGDVPEGKGRTRPFTTGTVIHLLGELHIHLDNMMTMMMRIPWWRVPRAAVRVLLLWPTHAVLASAAGAPATSFVPCRLRQVSPRLVRLSPSDPSAIDRCVRNVVACPCSNAIIIIQQPRLRPPVICSPRLRVSSFAACTCRSSGDGGTGPSPPFTQEGIGRDAGNISAAAPASAPTSALGLRVLERLIVEQSSEPPAPERPLLLFGLKPRSLTQSS